MVFNQQYDRDTVPGISFPEPSRTRQEFADEADINNLVKRYQQTGYFYDPNQRPSSILPQFGDFSNLPDFATVQNAIIAGQNAFNQLPVQIRARFNDDPNAFAAWVSASSEEDVGTLLASQQSAGSPAVSAPAQPASVADSSTTNN